MIIFLYGPDDFRREQKKKQVVEEFKKKHSNLGLDIFDFQEKDKIAGLKEFIRAQSIFDPVKMAVLEGVFPAKGESASGGDSGAGEELIGSLKSVLNDKKTTLLLSESGKPVKKLSFLTEKPAVSQKFDHLVGLEWQSFIKSESRRLGIDLDQSALSFLAAVYQNNTWGLVTELGKLQNLGGRLITKSDLEELSLEAPLNYWSVLNGLRGGSAAYRLSALDGLFVRGEPPAKIFNILASQWRERTPEMAEFDYMVKSGKLEYDEVLLDLILF